jgi:hypothetical protein
VWIFESMGNLEAFQHIVDVLEGLLNDPSKELEPEFRRTIIEELYRLGQIATFRVRSSDRLRMLDHLVPRLPSTPNQSLLILLVLLGAHTIMEEEELKEIQPKISRKLWELAESSGTDEREYLEDLFNEGRSAARRMNLDIPITDFEHIVIRRS